MSFADLEDRTNAAVMRRLANASARKVGGATDFDIIFDRAFVESPTGAGAPLPVATAQDSDIAAQALASHSSQLLIGGNTFNVRDIQPDGTGLSVLVLEAA